ncbi:uncharacterized protein LOC131948754 [Physella acuta]|uniref:uncharacterized protein LOC131948754 n=1 Tax=Physella acuta TaxID=109671 RepID=UPI0027DBEE51|nr:uncharacterized protein LOC131948754 [Physella acuta]
MRARFTQRHHRPLQSDPKNKHRIIRLTGRSSKKSLKEPGEKRNWASYIMCCAKNDVEQKQRSARIMSNVSMTSLEFELCRETKALTDLGFSFDGTVLSMTFEDFPFFTEKFFKTKFVQPEPRPHPQISRPLPQSEKITTGKMLHVRDVFHFVYVFRELDYAVVYAACRRNTKEWLWIKVVKKSAESAGPKRITNEVKCLTLLKDQPFFLTMLSAFQTNTGYYLVSPYQASCTMEDLIQSREFSTDDVRFYAAELSHAIVYLHRMTIIHRAINARNIMIDKEGHLFIADLGLVIFECNSKEKIPDTTSLTYFAPEIVLGSIYTSAIDWWSLGVLVYYMMYRVLPFDGTNLMLVISSILASEPVYKTQRDNIWAISFCRALLNKNPAKRLGYGKSGSLKVLNHQFFRPIDWAHIDQKLLVPPMVPEALTTLAKNPAELTSVCPAGSDTSLADWLTISTDKDKKYMVHFSYLPPPGQSILFERSKHLLNMDSRSAVLSVVNIANRNWFRNRHNMACLRRLKEALETPVLPVNTYLSRSQVFRDELQQEMGELSDLTLELPIVLYAHQHNTNQMPIGLSGHLPNANMNAVKSRDSQSDGQPDGQPDASEGYEQTADDTVHVDCNNSHTTWVDDHASQGHENTTQTSRGDNPDAESSKSDSIILEGEASPTCCTNPSTGVTRLAGGAGATGVALRTHQVLTRSLATPSFGLATPPSVLTNENFSRTAVNRGVCPPGVHVEPPYFSQSPLWGSGRPSVGSGDHSNVITYSDRPSDQRARHESKRPPNLARAGGPSQAASLAPADRRCSAWPGARLNEPHDGRRRLALLKPAASRPSFQYSSFLHFLATKLEEHAEKDQLHFLSTIYSTDYDMPLQSSDRHGSPDLHVSAPAQMFPVTILPSGYRSNEVLRYDSKINLKTQPKPSILSKLLQRTFSVSYKRRRKKKRWVIRSASRPGQLGSWLKLKLATLWNRPAPIPDMCSQVSSSSGPSSGFSQGSLVDSVEEFQRALLASSEDDVPTCPTQLTHTSSPTQLTHTSSRRGRFPIQLQDTTYDIDVFTDVTCQPQSTLMRCLRDDDHTVYTHVLSGSSDVGHGSSDGRHGSTDVGHGSTDVGHGSTDVGHGSTVVGHGSTFAGHGSTVVGHGSTVVGHGSTDAGHGSTFAGHGSTVVGHGSTDAGHGTTFAGHGSTVVGHGSTFAGHGSTVVGHGSTDVGHGSTVVGHGSTDAGHGSTFTGHGSTVVGHGSTDVGHGSTVVVHGSTSAGHGSTDVGHGSTFAGHGSTDVGHGSTDAGHGSTDVGHGSTDVVHGSTFAGHGSTDVGHGSTFAGHGSTDVGHGSTDAGHGSTDVGHGSTDVGHGSTIVVHGSTFAGHYSQDQDGTERLNIVSLNAEQEDLELERVTGLEYTARVLEPENSTEGLEPEHSTEGLEPEHSTSCLELENVSPQARHLEHEAQNLLERSANLSVRVPRTVVSTRGLGVAWLDAITPCREEAPVQRYQRSTHSRVDHDFFMDQGQGEGQHVIGTLTIDYLVPPVNGFIFKNIGGD